MKKKQLELNLYQGKRGGRRPGSGRKRLHSKGVAHRERDRVKRQTPMHMRLLKRAIVRARRFSLKVIHYSLQSNHIHPIVAAENNEVLTAGMRSLTITFAKGLKLGKVQLERYHLHLLKSKNETKNAVHYVLFNGQKHGEKTVDEYSSLLLLKNAVSLIRAYVTTNKVTLKIQKGELFELNHPSSFLLKSVFD